MNIVRGFEGFNYVAFAVKETFYCIFGFGIRFDIDVLLAGRLGYDFNSSFFIFVYNLYKVVDSVDFRVFDVKA